MDAGRPRTRYLVLFICVLLTAGVLPGVAMADSAVEAGVADEIDSACLPSVPEDYADPAGGTAGTTGWVDGYWYSEPIEADLAGPLSESDLESVVARTTARYEVLRCVQFEELPPIEVIDREEFDAESVFGFADLTAAERDFDNARLEAALLVPTEVDAIEQREANRGAVVVGYYDIAAGEVVLISDDGIAIDEATLAHELGHAYQDQVYGLDQFDSTRTDRQLAESGLVEGDVLYVEDQYESLCAEKVWDCLDAANGESGDIANMGLFLQLFAPYNDGAPFIGDIKERGDGWEAVDNLYADPPKTTMHVLDPATYPEMTPANPAVGSASGEWERLQTPEGPDHDRLGPATIAAAVMAPAFEEPEAGWFDEPAAITRGYRPDGAGPYVYDHPFVTGWAGDRLIVYTNDRGELASVWKSEWDSAEEATSFLDAYRDTLAYHGGASSPLSPVYTFTDESQFDGAVAIDRDGTAVTIVHAPSSDQIEAGTLPGTPPSGPTPLPGFGAIPALVGIAGAFAYLTRRPST